MRIAILSDFHLGHGWETELQEDSFEQARGALEIAVKADLVLIAGDIFDSRIPRQEVWARVLNLFYLPKLASSKTKLVKTIGREVPSHPLSTRGVPIVAIHGTHERRGRGFVNPVQLLDRAGYLTHLHGATAVYEKEGERVAITGMSGVPEIYARSALDKIKPKPVKGAASIFVFHQSVSQYIYSDESTPALRLEDLPKGFDLVVDGHVHWRAAAKIGPKKETLFLIPGSTLTTQVRKTEAGIPKGVTFYDTRTKKLDFAPLKTARPVVYEELDLGKTSAEEARTALLKAADSIRKKRHAKKPLVRVRLKGRLPRYDKAVSFHDIVKKLRDSMIVSVKNDLASEELERRTALLRDMQARRASVDELGLEELKARAEKAGLRINYEQILDYLVSDRVDEAERKIRLVSRK